MYFCAHAPRQSHTLVHGDALQRHERQHVRCADARMLAAMRIEVDELGGLGDGGQRRFSDRFGLARERHHAPVVVRVAVAIQHLGA